MGNSIRNFVKSEDSAVFCYSTDKDVHQDKKYNEDKDVSALKKRLAKAKKNMRNLYNRLNKAVNQSQRDSLMNYIARAENTVRRLEAKLESISIKSNSNVNV